jgi:D-tyrosyl-tRNA(Tyr) deacylase
MCLPESATVRIVCQRVSSASVRVEDRQVAAIGPGFCLLVGIARDDGELEVDAAVDKISGLRVFSDVEGKMNRSLREVGGEVLVVSQFTLLAAVGKGRRPSFTAAAPPDEAEPLVRRLAQGLRERGLTVAEGVFGARMEVALINEGPVTLILEVEGGAVR